MLVGDGEDKEKIENKIRQEDLTEHVVMCGVQLETEKYYSAFDVFVMPSISEGFGIVALEAQSAGLFCLLSDRVDESVFVTDRTCRIALEDNNQSEWVNVIYNNTNIYSIERKKYADLVTKSGYNMRETVQQVQMLFRQLV